jgi:taurine dioxygenase
MTSKGRHLRIERVGPVFGARLSGVDLAGLTAPAEIAEIAAALAEHEVLIVPDQRMDAEQQLDFGRRFGELVVSPFSPNADDAPELIILDYGEDSPARLTDIWHADETYRPEPPKITILKSIIVPELGGETMFCSMRAAYDGLSDRMKSHVAGLTAKHGFGRFDRLFSGSSELRRRLHAIELDYPHPDHPVVAVHPETGHKVLYVNRHFTERINELPEHEGRCILEFLLEQTARPESQLRVSWAPGMVVMWDNRSVQHYAPHDYWPQRRRLERVTVAGGAPIGDGESGEVAWSRIRVEGVEADDTGGHDQATREFER